jgi:hypothetical protein
VESTSSPIVAGETFLFSGSSARSVKVRLFARSAQLPRYLTLNHGVLLSDLLFKTAILASLGRSGADEQVKARGEEKREEKKKEDEEEKEDPLRFIRSGERRGFRFRDNRVPGRIALNDQRATIGDC